MQIEDVRDWLSEQGRDRFWLSNELGVSKRTLDNWFSSGFPESAVKHIALLMRDSRSPGKLKITLDQWKAIQAAAKNAGYDDEEEFIIAVLRDKLSL